MAERTRARRRSGKERNPYLEIYELLMERYGLQQWWPVTPPGETGPVYTGGPRTGKQRFEVAAGAVLTQNTAWSNAARAIEALNRERVMSPGKLSGLDEGRLARIIRPAGYYNQKAGRLKRLASFLENSTDATRESLLELNGIGPETADSILLYAFGKPYFVVDAYTRRIFGRIGLVDEGTSYERIRSSFESSLPRSVKLYQEYHALIVEHAKLTCRKKPNCRECCLLRACRMGKAVKKS